MDLSNLTIKQAHESLKTKQFSATELARAYFDRIKDKDEEIHAYLSVTEKLALEEAAKVDAKIADGSEFGLLEGVRRLFCLDMVTFEHLS